MKSSYNNRSYNNNNNKTLKDQNNKISYNLKCVMRSIYILKYFVLKPFGFQS